MNFFLEHPLFTAYATSVLLSICYGLHVFYRWSTVAYRGYTSRFVAAHWVFANANPYGPYVSYAPLRMHALLSIGLVFFPIVNVFQLAWATRIWIDAVACFASRRLRTWLRLNVSWPLHRWCSMPIVKRQLTSKT